MTGLEENRVADLHLHTAYSDGTYTPEELVRAAVRHGLAAIALTDHDSMEGCARTAAACRKENLEFVPGTELTAEADGHELHLLGYYVDPQDERLLAEMTRFQQVRQDRVREMVDRLDRMGIPLDPQAVFRVANCNAPGRPHVARALVQAGFCNSVDEAFDRYLKRNRPAWAPKMKITAGRAIRLIQSAGGVAVLAHPGLYQRDHLIPALAEAGLDGIECYHSKHSTAAAKRYVGVAEAHGLLVTGGSDCHGMTKGKPTIGTVRLPYERLVSLREAAEARRPTPPQARAAAPSDPPSAPIAAESARD